MKESRSISCVGRHAFRLAMSSITLPHPSPAESRAARSIEYCVTGPHFHMMRAWAGTWAGTLLKAIEGQGGASTVMKAIEGQNEGHRRSGWARQHDAGLRGRAEMMEAQGRWWEMMLDDERWRDGLQGRAEMMEAQRRWWEMMLDGGRWRELVGDGGARGITREITRDHASTGPPACGGCA